MKYYKAVCGDTWDSIAYKVFGDEFQFVYIMQANREIADVIMFNGGESIVIPDVITLQNHIIESPWQQNQAIRIIETPW